MVTRRAAIGLLVTALGLLLGGAPAAWPAPPQDVRIAIKGMVCPA
jgi:hypothetical protein